MKRTLLSLLLVLVMLGGTVSPAFAASDEAISAANALHELGLFSGTGTDANGNPNFDLDRTPTRQEAIVMLVRLLGKEQEAKAGTWEMPFTDVDVWAKPYVGYAFANGLATGTSATTFGGNDPVNATQYLTFVLRALGYTSGTDFQWDKAWELSDKLEITYGQYGKSESFSRNDIAVISLSTLNGTLQDGSSTLAELLIKSNVFTKEAYQKAAPSVDVWDGTVAASFAGGDGTEESPYLISSGAQLAFLAQETNKQILFNSTYFRLIRDIDLNNIDWTPIGNAEVAFCGSFDGNNHTISGLYINEQITSTTQRSNIFDTTSYWGLFSIIDGTLENLSVVGDVDVSHDMDTLSDDLVVGGIAGLCRGSIINCHFNGSVSGSGNNNNVDGYSRTYVGGITGRFGGSEASQLNHCSNSGSITVMASAQSGATVGGIVGSSFTTYGAIQNCWNSGLIVCDAQTVTTAHPEYKTLGDVTVGGIIGKSERLKVENCYNAGTISYSAPRKTIYNQTRIGGIIGDSRGKTDTGISNCYNIGKIDFTGKINPINCIGEITAYNESFPLKNCYWYNKSAKAVPFGKNDFAFESLGSFTSPTSPLSPYQSATLQYPGTLLDALNSWALEANKNGDTYFQWEIVKDENDGYPVLISPQ